MSADVLQFQRMDDAPNRIRELRLAKGWAQQKLADAIGRSKPTISELELGTMRLDTTYMRQIADALGVTAADLLLQRDNPYRLTPEERRLIDALRGADPRDRNAVEKMAEAILPFPVENDEAAA